MRAEEVFICGFSCFFLGGVQNGLEGPHGLLMLFFFLFLSRSSFGVFISSLRLLAIENTDWIPAFVDIRLYRLRSTGLSIVYLLGSEKEKFSSLIMTFANRPCLTRTWSYDYKKLLEYQRR